MTENRSPSIVVGIDGSEGSLTALRWALREGSTRGVSVEIVHCWQPHSLVDFAFGSLNELRTGSVCMLDNEVATALVGLDPQPDVVRTSVHGRPAATLLSRAADASLLVLGAHGDTNLADLMHGQVATTCLRHAPCPVAIIDRSGSNLGRSHAEKAATAG